jgi:hypothetical protein
MLTIGDTEWTSYSDATQRQMVRRTCGGYVLLVEPSTGKYWVYDARHVVAYGQRDTARQAMRDAMEATRPGPAHGGYE